MCPWDVKEVQRPFTCRAPFKRNSKRLKNAKAQRKDT